MDSSYRKRPASLVGSGDRLRTCIEESGETLDDWAEVLGVDTASLQLKLAKGGEVSARQLLAVDDLSGRAFLNPSERSWCAYSVSRTDAAYARKYGTAALQARILGVGLAG